MKLWCLLFGHGMTSEVVEQPNKKVIKIKMSCSRCGKEHGMLTWPNPAYAVEYVEGILGVPDESR